MSSPTTESASVSEVIWTQPSDFRVCNRRREGIIFRDVVLQKVLVGSPFCSLPSWSWIPKYVKPWVQPWNVLGTCHCPCSHVSTAASLMPASQLLLHDFLAHWSDTISYLLFFCCSCISMCRGIVTSNSTTILTKVRPMLSLHCLQGKTCNHVSYNIAQRTSCPKVGKN